PMCVLGLGPCVKDLPRVSRSRTQLGIRGRLSRLVALDGGDELERMDLATRRREQDREVAQPLGIPQAERVAVERDRPVLTCAPERSTRPRKHRSLCIDI